MNKRHGAFACLLVLSACSGTSSPGDTSPNDAIAVDVAGDAIGNDSFTTTSDVVDVRAASDVIDATPALDASDARAIDATDVVDVTPALDASDAAAIDATTDVQPFVCLSDAGCAQLSCTPAPPPSTASTAISVSSNIWIGWRFEITAGAPAHLRRIGLSVASNSLGGTLFGAVVTLGGPNAMPMPTDLSGSDVLLRTSVTLAAPSAGSQVVGADVDLQLGVGWYAIVFGSGAFGASATSASVFSTPGTTGCTDPQQFPFSLRQSDGAFIPQGQGAFLYVELTGT